MASTTFKIMQNVKATRAQMRDAASRGWRWFVIRPDGTLHSKHKTEAGTRHNINEYMRAEGYKVWECDVSAK